LAGAPVLAEVPGSLTVTPDRGSAPAATFAVRVILADAARLYAQQRERAWLFGGLIVAATATAFIGLLSAHRAFHRELRLSEMKSNFASSVSHELRAPIASVRLLAESLELGKVTDEVRRRDYFRLIGQECRRLSSVIENTLDFSRIEQGRKQYELEPTDLKALIEQTVRLLEPSARERDVELRLIEAPAMDRHPLLDGKSIQQALVNLIENALKHSPPQSEVRVTLELHTAPPAEDRPKLPNGRAGAGSATQTAARITVTDEGPGIPPAEHQRIFEPFYRLGSELRRETTGVGIGLSIVKHIVEGHRGRVGVESRPGQGTCFIIELPLELPPAEVTE
jgi:two-component system phosphate regulon sensor histidine kinase PhoR